MIQFCLQVTQNFLDRAVIGLVFVGVELDEKHRTVFLDRLNVRSVL